MIAIMKDLRWRQGEVAPLILHQHHTQWLKASLSQCYIPRSLYYLKPAVAVLYSKQDVLGVGTVSNVHDLPGMYDFMALIALHSLVLSF